MNENNFDLTKSQLVMEDILVRVWNSNKKDKKERYLAIIDHRNDCSFIVWNNGQTGKEQDYCYYNVTSYENCELIKPKQYRVKDFYSLVDSLKEKDYILKFDLLNKAYLENFKEESRSFSFEMFRYCGKEVFKEPGIDLYHLKNSEYYYDPDWVEEIPENE